MMTPTPCPLIWPRQHPHGVWQWRTNIWKYFKMFLKHWLRAPRARGEEAGEVQLYQPFPAQGKAQLGGLDPGFATGMSCYWCYWISLETHTSAILGSVPMTSQFATYCLVCMKLFPYCLVSMKLFHAILCLGFIFFCWLYLHFLLMKSRIGPFGVCIFFSWELIHHCVGSVPTAVNGNYVLWRRMRP